MSPTVVKLLVTVVAAGLYALAEVPALVGVRDLLVMLAGGLAGGAFVRRPGDVRPVDGLPLG